MAVQHTFQAEVSQVLRLVIHSLYANKEIFLRELVSNASDAVDRRRFAAIQRPELLGDGETSKIRLSVDKQAGTLTISDNGIGMSRDELEKNLGTIAWSGSRDFLQKLDEAKAEGQSLPQLIGQFGVGFYSAFLVADKVAVVSRAADSETAHRWESTGEEGFSIEPGERDGAGTSVILTLKPDQREYLEPHRLRMLVQRYSDYIAHTIELSKADDEKEFEVVNRASALWQRPPKEVERAQYVEFYKHLAHDWEEPLAYRHFRIEGTQLFTGLLFVPNHPPFDLPDAETRHGVRLHVKRVFVMDNCEELVPRWLRFVRGVIDSEDLPLNVSREILQDNRVVRTIRKQVVQQTLELLVEVARDRPDDYLKFWQAFGAVLKEGLYFDPEHQEKLGKLVRYESAKTHQPIGLDEYIAAMPEGQGAIYYVAAATQKAAASSPHLERARAKGYDVLLMYDPVDPFSMSSFTEYAGKPLVSVTSADLALEGESADSAEKKAEEAAKSPLFERVERVLKDKVEKVRASSRLTDSPACLVIPEGGLAPHVERLLRAQKRELPPVRRILELNLAHPLVQSIERLEAKEPGSARVVEWMELLYDQALLAEGSPIDDPAAFAKRLSTLMTSAAEHDLGSA